MTKKVKEKTSKKRAKDNSLFDIDNEIIIGIKNLPQPEKPKAKKKKQATAKGKKTTKKKVNKKTNKKIVTKKAPKQNETTKKKQKNILRLIKWTILILIFIGGGIFFILSPFFNVKQIQVSGNSKITSQELISLSEIQLEENTFKIVKSQVYEKIKQNAYIESVKIKRKLPNTVQIEVTERTPTYMISLANAYVYMNNQGYFLEVSKEKLENPIIAGYSTKESDIKAGSRLCTEDLEKLNDVLQIMKSLESNDITTLITKINISNRNNYILELKNEKKTIHMGNCTNLSTKALYIRSIIDENKKVEGEIFVNTDLNNKGAIFRKKI